jgi:hypothetical protein
MKFPIILFSAFFGAALFHVGLAMAQTARPSQAVTATYQQAMDKCQEMYAGYRGGLGHQRYFNIEMCFKNLTGKYPAQVNMTCTVCNCRGGCRASIPSKGT